jgi:hypothetical protein
MNASQVRSYCGKAPRLAVEPLQSEKSMQNEFQKRFRWWVLITYSSIVFFGELIHAIPGMQCRAGCTSGHGCTPRHHDDCVSRPITFSKSISKRENSSNLDHCIFCKKRNRKSAATERSAAIVTSAVVDSTNRIEICEPSELCPVCKLMAGFSSSLPQYSETDLGSDVVLFALFGEIHLSLTFSVPYSPRGPPRDVIL